MQAKLPKQLRDIRTAEKLLRDKPEKFWLKRGEDMVMNLFRQMSQRVPAYQDFLKQTGFDPKTVKSINDFAKIPLIDKDNYLRKYPLAQLCWDGSFSQGRNVISATSGSTGEPFYFPRSDLQDEYYSLTAELYLRQNFNIQDKTTLYVNAFAMGIWIGGLFTYEAIHRVSQKGYPLTIISPGVNKQEVVNAVNKLGKHFDQVIIGCYPPMLRDIIELGNQQGVNWASYNLGVVFSAEGFSESFRDYIAEQAGLSNIYTSTLNHYGTVDLGTMSHETPTSILVRRHALKHGQLYESLFGTVHKQPTVTQYLPEMFYFEMVDDGIVCSSYSGLPLVRYDLKDRGGVLKFEDLKHHYSRHGESLDDELAQAGLLNSKWNLPLVYVYERKDFSVSWVGANIYPEEIHKALILPEIRQITTGKFTMEITYDKKMNSKLLINVELKPAKEPKAAFVKQIQKTIVETLLQENTEYVSNYNSYGKQLQPQIKLWPYEHPLHFSGQGKQKWVKKSS